MLGFYYCNYIVLSCIGWISIADLRFDNEYTKTEQFSSLIGIGLCVFSITYPLAYFIIIHNKIKPMAVSLPKLDIIKEQEHLD